MGKGVMAIDEHERVLKTMVNNITPGTDELTPKFYRYCWNLLGSFVVGSIHYDKELFR